MTAPRIMKKSVITISMVGLIASLAAPVTAAERNCDARYTWETTGGSLKGTFARFNGRGLCGGSVPNRCRKRAHDAINTCARVHWEKRWDRTVPEACVFTNSDSTVENYDLSKRCSHYTWQRPQECAWFVDNTEGEPLIHEVMAKKGDIKASLEADVCCVHDNGNFRFSNNRAVHVRAGWTISGDNHCPGSGKFTDDYVINCKAFRQAHCAHGNLWD